MGFIDVTSSENQRRPPNQPAFELCLCSSEVNIIARRDCTDRECDRCLIIVQRRTSKGPIHLFAWRAPNPGVAQRFTALLAKVLLPTKDGFDPTELIPYQLRRMANEGELITLESVFALQSALANPPDQRRV